MHYLVGYMAVVGGLAAGLRAARGLARGCRRLAEGDARGAAEPAGGLVAPLAQAAAEAGRLAVDFCACVSALSDDDDAADEPGGRSGLAA